MKNYLLCLAGLLVWTADKTWANSDRCSQPMDPGSDSCAEITSLWYYDADSGQCMDFMYTGCEGNDNQFQSMEDCQAECMENNICSLPMDRGPCDAFIPSWYHDSLIGECMDFIYGGCAGNKNNFETQEECQLICNAY